ncbi:MAG: FliH/SctL family protein [Desulfobacteraceae bacterium]|nr:FliH/SctL family protein [Desulfobacteraceae bacterium]
MIKSQPSAPGDKARDFRCMPFSSSSATPAEKGGDACTLFKPLFSCAGESGSAAAKAKKDPAIRMAEARDNGLEKGLKCGCEEALAMGRASLRPGLRAFIQTLNSLGHQTEQIKTHVSAGILVLALEVVRQILGEECSIGLEELSALKESLGVALTDANRLGCALHPDDLTELQSLVAADELCWPCLSAVDFLADPSLQPGEVLHQEQARQSEALDATLIEALTSIFSNHFSDRSAQ